MNNFQNLNNNQEKIISWISLQLKTYPKREKVSTILIAISVLDKEIINNRLIQTGLWSKVLSLLNTWLSQDICSVSMFNGLPIIIFSILKIKDKFYDLELDSYLTRLIEKTNTSILFLLDYLKNEKFKMEHFDLVSGISGTLYFLIEINDERLNMLILPITDFITEQLNKEFRKNKSYSISFAHGLSGILYILSKVSQTEYIKHSHVSLIKKILNFVMNTERNSIFLQNQYSLIRGINKCNSISWCYGCLGIWYSLRQTSHILNEVDIYKYYNKKLINLLNSIEMIYELFEDSYLCHGAGGLLLYYWHLRSSNAENLNLNINIYDIINKISEKIDLKDESDLNILSSKIGIWIFFQSIWRDSDIVKKQMIII